MSEPALVMYVLMPFRAELKPVYAVFDEVGQMKGYRCERSDLERSVTDILEKIIHGIYGADLVIADLTGSNRNVFYELGVANALSKECIMVTQDELRELPFDIRNYTVIKYETDSEGLRRLKDNLARVIANRQRIKGPVNTALDTMFKRNRTLSYLLSGAVGGSLLSLPFSLITALLGASFFGHWQGPGHFWRTVFEGGPPAFFAGAFAFAGYSLVYNMGGAALNRAVMVLVEGLAGLIVGVITFLGVFLLDVQVFGAEIALGTSTPWVILFAVLGLGLGFAFNIQAPRQQPETFSTHIMRATLACVTAVGLGVVLIYVFRARIFFEAFLEHFQLIDAINDGLRLGLWGIAISGFQWWLRWRVKL